MRHAEVKCPRTLIVIACLTLAACAASRPIRYYRLEIPEPLAPSAGAGFGVTVQVQNTPG